DRHRLEGDGRLYAALGLPAADPATAGDPAAVDLEGLEDMVADVVGGVIGGDAKAEDLLAAGLDALDHPALDSRRLTLLSCHHRFEIGECGCQIVSGFHAGGQNLCFHGVASPCHALVAPAASSVSW